MDDYSRAYVYGALLRAPTLNATSSARSAARRQYQTSPTGVVVENGPQCKGDLLAAVCAHLGMRRLPASVCRPQTPGKVERAGREDRRADYAPFEAWIVAELTPKLPA
jgi:hypothetical protein